jgi:hypothetical protein
MSSPCYAIDPCTGARLRPATPAETAAYAAQPVRAPVGVTTRWPRATWFEIWARPVRVGAVLVDRDAGPAAPSQDWCD